MVCEAAYYFSTCGGDGAKERRPVAVTRPRSGGAAEAGAAAAAAEAEAGAAEGKTKLSALGGRCW